MTNATQVPAYAYQADLYCPSCIGPEVSRQTYIGGTAADREPAEAHLDRIARILRIDRADESSFDSDRFPKVVGADQLRREPEYPLTDEDGGETADRCGRCGSLL